MYNLIGSWLASIVLAPATPPGQMTQPSSTFHGVIIHHPATGLEFKIPKQSGFDKNKNQKSCFRNCLRLVRVLTFVEYVELDHITISFMLISDSLFQIANKDNIALFCTEKSNSS